MKERAPLYDECRVPKAVLSELKDADALKYEKMLEQIEPCQRLVDVGCGWGQFLRLVQSRVEELWAVDESPHRKADVAAACPTAKMIISRAEQMNLPSDYFQVTVTSQMLHEAKLFGDANDMERIAREVCRILEPGGKWLIQDHIDAGDGYVDFTLPPSQILRLSEFESKFRYDSITHETQADGLIRISRRHLQDFLTKSMWLNSTLEDIEMNETHNVFTQDELADLVTRCGFRVEKWITFSNIVDDLDRHEGRLVDGKPWNRKGLLVAVKA